MLATQQVVVPPFWDAVGGDIVHLLWWRAWPRLWLVRAPPNYFSGRGKHTCCTKRFHWFVLQFEYLPIAQYPNPILLLCLRCRSQHYFLRRVLGGEDMIQMMESCF